MTKRDREGDGIAYPTAADIPTAAMPALGKGPTATMPLAPSGLPPVMPAAQAGVATTGGAVDEPARMPGPNDIPGGEPDDPAAAPGRLPAGEVDACSLRRGVEFALVYRRGTVVIGRFGRVGTRGRWRTIEYPTVAAASIAFAEEVARLFADGWHELS